MIDTEKKALRKKIKALKAEVSFEEKKLRSKNIFLKLEQNDFFINTKTVMLYWSMKDEVFTHDFVIKWASCKEIILPSVDGDNLILKKFTGKEDLIAGDKYEILEPGGKVFENENEIDLIVVPGVAFDKQNNRMGRGKAYYDKLLKTLKAKKIGVCFDFQLLDNIPHDKYDVKMDLVISE
ncbi:MAG: 5-formyltetrahydrofolate cyclo-ligase [Bacteroidetes bacterium]|nr:MAG: 5-formyltetrahydrofolate cyclo-ligase [Bacteroidota bacterium]